VASKKRHGEILTTENTGPPESACEQFEKQVADYIGTRHAVLCSSGRSAIRYSLLALGVGHGDEVIIPDFACEILPITVFCSGATPKFCDIERNTLALSPENLKKSIGPKTKALIFVHLYGIPADPKPILEIAQKVGVAFVDDAAQALGASIKGQKIGSFGDLGILSLNKFLNVRLGGVALTNNEELAAKVRAFRQKYERRARITSIGYHTIESLRIKSRKSMTAVFLTDYRLYKLLNVTLARKAFHTVDGWVNPSPYIVDSWVSNTLKNKAINQLLVFNGKYWQRRRLEKLEILTIEQEFMLQEKYLEKRRKIAKIYQEKLKEEAFIKFPTQTNASPSYMKFPVSFFNNKKMLKCANELSKSGFPINYNYRPLHTSPFFGSMNKESKFEESTYMADHILPLPVEPNMSSEKIEELISIVNAKNRLT
jgi:dTDP-4-amino-4,6-dideoxygalactose transaminase